MRKLILKDITYLVYCIVMDRKPERCDTLDGWCNFVKEACNEHNGDCTDEPHSCVRCQYEEILVKATQIRNYLKYKGLAK